MKIYYNFVKHEFVLQPNGPCMSSETGELFDAKNDLIEFRYYPDCECVEMYGDKIKLYIIYYEDQHRDYFGHKTRHDLDYFNNQLQEYTFEGYVPVIVKKNYEKFGYNIQNKKYEGENGVYFMISTWTRYSR